jgi:hypothetical protein
VQVRAIQADILSLLPGLLFKYGTKAEIAIAAARLVKTLVDYPGGGVSRFQKSVLWGVFTEAETFFEHHEEVLEATEDATQVLVA